MASGHTKARGAVAQTAHWLLLAIAVSIILLALLLVFVRLALPLLGGYKGEIEARLTEQFGSPVSIEDLSIRWQGFGPRLSAFGVSVQEPNGQQVSLKELLIDVDVSKSLKQKKPVIEEMILIGAELALETDEKGQWRVHGVASQPKQVTASSGQDKGVDVLAWLMNTRRVALQDARITIINKEDNQTLELDDINVVAENDGSLHQLRVDLQLPESLGKSIEIGMDVTGKSNDIANAEADIYVKAVDLKADAWRSLRAGRFRGLTASTTGIARLDANVQMDFWGNVSKGELQSARGRMLVENLTDVTTQKNVLDRIETDLVFTAQDTGWRVGTDSVLLEADATTTTINDVQYNFQPSKAAAWTLDAKGNELALDLATRLVLSLFDENADLPRAQWLAKAQPAGTMVNWDASIGLINGTPDFSFRSGFYDVRLNAADGIPGFENLGGSILMQNNVGTLTMQGSEMALDMPNVFTAPARVGLLRAALDIDVTDPLRTTIDGDVQIEEQGFESDTRIEIKLDPHRPTQLYIQSKYSLDDLAVAKGFIPNKLIKPATTSWFKKALVAGSIDNGELLMFGDIADFPFRDKEGVFKTQFDMRDVTLDYLPAWPQLTGMEGRFNMSGPGVSASVTDGFIDGLRLSQAKASIPDIFKPVLSLNSTGAGKLSELVAFGNTGPLKWLLNPILSDVSASGRAQMDLALSVPLSRLSTFNTVASAQASVNKTSSSIPGLKVDGALFMLNNDVSFARSNVDLSDVNGAIIFSQNDFRIHNLEAKSLGRPIRVETHEQGRGKNKVSVVNIYGSMGAKDVLDNYDIPLTRFVDGESRWRVQLFIPLATGVAARDGITFKASSDLVGTRLLMPLPLGKPPSQVGDFVLSSVIKDGLEPEWEIAYAGFLKAHVTTDDDGLKSLSARFGSGALSKGLARGIRLDGTVNQIGLDGWVESIAALLDDLAPADSPTPVLPISANLRVNSLVVGTQAIGEGLLRANTDGTYINVAIDNRLLRANARYPREHWRDDIPMHVRIAHVDMNIVDALDTAPEKKAGEQGGELDPRELPPIEAHVSNLQWDALNLKDVRIRTSPTSAGLRIDTLGFNYQTVKMTGEGYWRLRNPQTATVDVAENHVTRLNVSVQSNDFGEGLTQIGFAGALKDTDGTLNGSLYWPAPAYKPDLELLVGEVKIDLQRGSILKVDPGAAKLAGLFALDSIPRRLNLDFSDLVRDGLDFETLEGEVQLANGIAHAPLVQLNGSVGVVDITGESNLIGRNYNQTITVLPRVSAALPVIGLISAGATGGIGALLAGGIFKAIGLDFDRIGLTQYKLTGDWETPRFELLQLSQTDVDVIDR